jgi:hypothetical protein
MDRTLREHLEELEAKRQMLTAPLLDEEPGGLKARCDLAAELRAVESAITLCRSAFEIEGRLTKPQRPFPEA